MRVSLDGESLGSVSGLAGWSGVPTHNVWGAKEAGGAAASPSDIAEIIVFDRALTVEEVCGLEQGLAAKYGLGSLVSPIPTPIPTNSPTPLPTPTVTSIVNTTPTATPIPTNSPTPLPTPTPVPYGDNTVYLYPLDDAYVSSEFPDGNYGSNKSLLISNTSKLQRPGYLKFDLTQLGGINISSAKLRLYIADSSPYLHNLYNTADTSWKESTITFNNRPTPDSASFASFSNAIAGTWVEVDITAYTTLKTGQLFSMMIEGNSDRLSVNTEENINKPVLVVTY